MAPKLQIKRGLKKDLPTLASGEFGLCEDTGELFVGTQNGNLPVRSEAGAGDMLKSVYDTDNDGVVDRAESVPWAGVTGKPASLPANGGNADTLDGKHASEFVPATGGTVNGQLAVTNNVSAGELRISKKDGYLVFNDGGNREFFMHSDDGIFYFHTRKDGKLVSALQIDANGTCGINGASTSTGVINAGNENYTDGTHKVRMGWFGSRSVLCFQIDGESGASNVYIDRARTALLADAVAWGNVTGKPSTFAPSSHTHDDRYYTESEMNTKLNGKANTSGTYSGLSVGYATNSASSDQARHPILENGNCYTFNFGGTYLSKWTSDNIFHIQTGTVYCNNNNNNGWVPIYASAFTQQSSRRYKENIHPLTSDEARQLLSLEPVKYDYINKIDGLNRFGLIAEDAYAVQEQGVVLREIEGESLPDGIDYASYVPQLIKLCQLQQAQIDALAAENKQLTDALAALAARVTALEKGA